MKAISIRSFLVIISTLIMSFIWLRYPHFFPSLSEEQAIRLVNLFNAKNGEEIADLELYLVMSCSFLISLLLLLVGILGRRMLTNASS